MGTKENTPLHSLRLALLGHDALVPVGKGCDLGDCCGEGIGIVRKPLPHLAHTDAACPQTTARVGRVWTLEVRELHVDGIGIPELLRIGSAFVDRKLVEELTQGYDLRVGDRG